MYFVSSSSSIHACCLHDGDELVYSVPECSLDDGIDLLHDDNSVLKMVNFAKKHNFAEIYVKHKGSESIVVNQSAGSKEKLAEEVLYTTKMIFSTCIINLWC